MEEENKQLKKKLEELQKEFDILESENVELRKQLGEMTQQLSGKDSIIEELQRKIKELEEYSKESVDKAVFNDALETIKALKSKIQELVIQNQKLQETIKLKDEIINALKSEPVRLVKSIPAQKPIVKKRREELTEEQRARSASNSLEKSKKVAILLKKALNAEREGKFIRWGDYE